MPENTTNTEPIYPSLLAKLSDIQNINSIIDKKYIQVLTFC